MISEDANFKMKGRDRSSRDKDPTLGPGWAYMVANDKYLQYLAEHVNEDEVFSSKYINTHTDDPVDQSLCFFCRPLVCEQ
jgi:hypothetical protein